MCAGVKFSLDLVAIQGAEDSKARKIYGEFGMKSSGDTSDARPIACPI